MSNCKFYKKQQEVKYPGSDDWIPTGQYEKGNLIEEDSPDCGYTPPTPSGYADQYYTIITTNSGTSLQFFGSSAGTTANTSIQYSTDSGITWSYLASGSTISNLDANTKVMFKGTLTPIANKGIGTIYVSSGYDDSLYIEGNPMSLLFGDNFRGQYSLDGKSYAFYNLVSDAISCANLVLPATILSKSCYERMFTGSGQMIHPPSVLPALTLVQDCYKEMFRGCRLKNAPQIMAVTMATNCCSGMFEGCTLTIPPQLPSTTLAPYCYNDMFRDCRRLTTTPEFPATTMATGCYQYMFNGCTNLTGTTTLPATTLANFCYYGMFEGCTSLTTVPSNMLPATTLTTQCYEYMFKDCVSLITAPQLPSTTLEYMCYNGMFKNCTSLTSAPVLSAPKLKSHCYYEMFTGCDSLNYIKCLATDKTAYNCTYDWVDGVAQNGTFAKAISATWSRGTAGVPDNWTIQDSTS